MPAAANQNLTTRSPEPSAEASPRPPLVAAPSSQTVVQSVRLVESIGQSEMHIGLRTQAFGSVEVHTALRDAQLGLAVSSEKGDLRGFLQPDVPAIQSVLQQHDLRLENIRFSQPGIDLGSGSPGNSESPPRSFTGNGGSFPATSSASEGDEELADNSGPGNRLSVHA